MARRLDNLTPRIFIVTTFFSQKCCSHLRCLRQEIIERRPRYENPAHAAIILIIIIIINYYYYDYIVIILIITIILLIITIINTTSTIYCERILSVVSWLGDRTGPASRGPIFFLLLLLLFRLQIYFLLFQRNLTSILHCLPFSLLDFKRVRYQDVSSPKKRW